MTKGGIEDMLGKQLQNSLYEISEKVRFVTKLGFGFQNNFIFM